MLANPKQYSPFHPSTLTVAPCCLLAVWFACGCSATTTTVNKHAQEISVTLGGKQICINAASTPTQVAEAALTIATAGDHQTFARLIADQTVSSDFQSITGGREKFREFASESNNLTAGILFRKLSSLDSDSWQIISETITGDRASVKIAGQTQGQERSETLYFQRESGLWQLVPSHL